MDCHSRANALLRNDVAYFQYRHCERQRSNPAFFQMNFIWDSSGNKFSMTKRINRHFELTRMCVELKRNEIFCSNSEIQNLFNNQELPFKANFNVGWAHQPTFITMSFRTGFGVSNKASQSNAKFVILETLKQSWIIGGSTGSTQLSPRRAGFTPFTRRTCQNPQFRVTQTGNADLLSFFLSGLSQILL